MRGGVIALLFLTLAAGVALAQPYHDQINTEGEPNPSYPYSSNGMTERDYFGTQGRSTAGEKCVGNVIPVRKIAGGKSWSPGCYAIRGDPQHARCGCISWPDDPYSVQEFKADGLPVCTADAGQQPDGGKGIGRTPMEGPHAPRGESPGIERMAEEIDDCLRHSVKEGYGLYDTPPLVEYSVGTAVYSRGSVYYNPSALNQLPPDRLAYTLAEAYADHALYLRNRYVKFNEPGIYEVLAPSSADNDRVVGYVTRCLMAKGLLPMPMNLAPEVPTHAYGAVVHGDPARLAAFNRGFKEWPLSPLYRPKLERDGRGD